MKQRDRRYGVYKKISRKGCEPTCQFADISQAQAKELLARYTACTLRDVDLMDSLNVYTKIVNGNTVQVGVMRLN